MTLILNIGKRYGYTFPEYRFPEKWRKPIPPSTVYFTVTGEDDTFYHVHFENGSCNKISKTSPIHKGAFAAPLAN